MTTRTGAGKPAHPSVTPVAAGKELVLSRNRSHLVPGITVDVPEGTNLLPNGNLVSKSTGRIITAEAEANRTPADDRRDLNRRSPEEAARYAMMFTPTMHHRYSRIWSGFEPQFRRAIGLIAENPSLSPDIANLINALLAFVGWYVTTVGSFGEVTELLTNDMIKTWIREDTRLSARSAGTFRSRVRKIAREIAPDIYVDDVPSNTVRAQTYASPPYTRQEMALLLRRVSRDLVDTPRREGEVAIWLGHGAGLDGNWMAGVTPEHVVRRGGVVTIWVPNPQRYIPVTAPYADLLWALAKQMISEGQEAFSLCGYPVMPRKNAASDLVFRVNYRLVASSTARGGVPKLSLSRLRNTWLVDHLQSGTRLKELLAAAGLTTCHSMDRLMDYVQPLPASQALRHLAGRGL